MENKIEAGQVYQLGSVIPHKGWKEQPPLVHIIGAMNEDGMVPVVYPNGWKRGLIDPNATPMEYRGTLTEADLKRSIELAK